MADLKEKSISLLSSTSVTMTASSSAETLYTVPAGKVCRIVGYCVKNASATLAGGTSFSVTNFKQTVDLSSITTDYVTAYFYIDGNNAKYVETAAAVAIQLTKTTGSTGAATATIDLFGYIENA